MARTNNAARPTKAAEASSETAPATILPDEAKNRTATEQSRQPAYAPDPHPLVGVSLSDHNGGPTMHLLRSHRYKQMQIRFDGQQPDEKYLTMLAKAGWRDRTESEGVFTKQIDPDARWQSVQQMEREFKQVANAIRESKGLEPALEGFAVV